MKKLTLKQNLTIIIFLIMIISSLAVVIPVYRKVSGEIRRYMEGLCLYFQNQTGLKLSYKSISPSVLTGIKVNSVSFINPESKENEGILKIDSIVLGYNLWKLITGSTDEAFSELTVDGIVFDFNSGTDFTILEKLKAFVKEISKNKSDSGSETEDGTENGGNNDALNLSSAEFKVPVDINIKNVELRFVQDDFVSSANLRKILFDYDPEKLSIDISTEGTLKFSKGKNEYSGRFTAGGTVPENLDGTSLILRLSNLTDGDLLVGRINTLLTYENHVVELKTVQNNYPFYVLARYAADEKTASVSVKAENLTASSLIVGSKNTEVFEKIKGVTLTVDFDGDYDFNSRKLNYSSQGKISASDKTLSGGLLADYKIAGNESEIYVDRLLVSGKNFDTGFNGSFSFKNLGLSGTAEIKKILLEKGGVISTEIYFDPLESGFMGFAPEVFLGEKVFTALQFNVIPHNDSVDFDLEVSDYSHQETEPGQIVINGSFLPENSYIQASCEISRLYLDSIMQTETFFTDPSNKAAFSVLENYEFQGAFYASSDFKTLTFNVPYVLVANTKADNEVLELSLDGNPDSIQLSQCDYVKNGKKTSLTAQYDKNPDADEYFISASLNVNSIPYNFTGTVMPGVISINGDYGVSLELYKSGKNRYDGSLSMANLPVPAGDSVFSLACDTVLNYTEGEGFNLQIASFSASETTSTLAFTPRLNLKGSVSKYGVLLDEISYSDIYSALTGKASGSWQIYQGIFQSCGLDFDMHNPDSSENLQISVQVSNPDSIDINGTNFSSSLYFNSQIIMKNFNLNRFTVEQSENNAMTATFAASGTVENPYAGITVDSASLMMNGNIIRTNFTAFLEDKKITLSDCYLKYNDVEVKDLKASVDLNSFEGSASASLDATVAEKTVSAPLELTLLSDSVKDGQIPEEFTVNLSARNIKGSLFREDFPLEFTVHARPEKITFFTSDLFGIRGTVSKNGDIEVNVKEGKPLYFNARGNIGEKEIFIMINDIYADAGVICKNVVIDWVTVFQGKLKGNLQITGLKSDPYFEGKLDGTGLDFNFPGIIPDHITVEKKATLKFEHNEIYLVDENPDKSKKKDPSITEGIWGKIKKSYPIYASLKIFMDRWNLDHIDSHISTGDSYGPADLDVRVATFKGMAKINLDLMIEDNYTEVTGDVWVQKTTARTVNKELLNKTVAKDNFVRTDLTIHLGQHVNFQFDPVLRCLFAPDSVFKFKYDEEDGSVYVNGNVDLRSGDIAYLSRNFYLKSGSLKFNGNDSDYDLGLDPIITVKAETRERDESGNEIRIILTAENQLLSQFNPQFSSVPARSESEIRTLLGQIVSADSDDATNLLLATSDYAVQSLLGRSVENKLRDFFNFDILSIRTMVLQNALRTSLSTDKSKSKNIDNDITIGNLLDNSTVYIGKYLGSNLYVDALMHWSYDESRRNDAMTPGGLVFKPEFGLEVETPFANIRWNMAPEITDSIEKKLVSSTSVTLSWKFSF